jgi:hypothetical protein
VGNHGVFTEVSRTTYIYSYIHTISIWITHPLTALAMIALLYMRRKQNLLGARQGH